MREEDKFTYKEEMEYPSENDIVDVKVLNNDIRLLEEKKATKEEVENAVSDINTSVGEKMTNVAKESQEYSIENRLKELENFVKNMKIEDRIHWKSLKNLRYHAVDYRTENKKLNYDATILNVSGRGNLIMALMSFYSNGLSRETPGMRVTVDGEIIYEVRGENSVYGQNDTYQLGIVNDTYMLREEIAFSCIGIRIASTVSEVPLVRISAKTRRDYSDVNLNMNNYYMIQPYEGWSIPLSNRTYYFRPGDGEVRQSNIAGVFNPCTSFVKNPIRYNRSLKIELFETSCKVIGAVMYNEE